MKKSFVLLLVFMMISASLVFADRPASGAVIVDSLKYEPYPAESGSYFKLWIKMENYGAKTAEDVTFMLDPKFPFSIDNNEVAERYIGSLDAGEEVVLEYTVRVNEDAVEGNNELEFRFTSDGKAWIVHTFDIFIRTQDTMLNTQSVSVSPEEVAPGDIATVSIMVKNMADSTIKDLRAELELTQREVLAASVDYTELPFTPVDSTNVLMANSLGPKEQKIFTYRLRVDPDTDPKVYRIPLSLTYSDEIGNTTYAEEGIIAIVVAKSPDIMINLDESSIYTKNAKGEVTIGVYNIGMSRIKFSVIELIDGEGYEILSNPKIYLGNVDSDDYETADFNVYITEENPELNIMLNYKDDYNQEHQEQASLLLKTYSGKDAKKYGFIVGSSGGVIFFVIAILGIGALVYFRKIKKKQKR